MATTTDEAKSSIAKVGATVRAPLISTIAVIAVVGGGYYAFYRGQVEYYTGRDRRLISTLMAQSDGRVAMYSRYFREGILKPDVSPPIATTVEEPILRIMNETPPGWALRLQNAKGLVATVQLDD